MIYPDYIVSTENKHIKKIKKILNSPKDFPEFVVVEGGKNAREFDQSIYFRLVRWFIIEEKKNDFLWIDPDNITIISKKVLEYLSDLENSQGIIGLFSAGYSLFIQSYIPSQATFILDKISDPGNLGALIRTAVALGRSTVILIDGVFPFSPKVIRASAGMIAHIKIIYFTFKEFSQFLFECDIKLVKMHMKADTFLFNMRDDFQNYFILLGNEGNGVRKEFDMFLKKSISLPMSEKAESLNVSIAGSIVGYLIWGKL